MPNLCTSRLACALYLYQTMFFKLCPSKSAEKCGVAQQIHTYIVELLAYINDALSNSCRGDPAPPSVI